MEASDFRPPFREYWSWLSVALFLLVTLDLLTSLFAAAAVGLEAEGNPVMAWLLGQPLAVVVGVHLAVVFVAAAGFYALLESIERSPDSVTPVLTLLVELWLGLLVAVGLAVFANNLSVIVHGTSPF